MDELRLTLFEDGLTGEGVVLELLFEDADVNIMGEGDEGVENAGGEKVSQQRPLDSESDCHSLTRSSTTRPSFRILNVSLLLILDVTLTSLSTFVTAPFLISSPRTEARTRLNSPWSGSRPAIKASFRDSPSSPMSCTGDPLIKITSVSVTLVELTASTT